MSFRPKEKNTGDAQAGGQELGAALGFLQAMPATGHACSDPMVTEKNMDDVRKKTLRTLNAIKIVAPIMSAIVEKHSVSGSEDGSVGMFKRLVQQASEMSEIVIKELGEDAELPSNFWLRNMLERVFCEILKDQVQRGKECGLKPMEPLLRTLVKMDWGTTSSTGQEFETWASGTLARAALVRAASPIIIKAATFDFFRTNFEHDMESIMTLLMTSASRATLSIVDPSAGEKEKASLFAVLAGEAGNLYASAWHACGRQVVAMLDSLSDKDLKVLLADNPKGLSLDKVNETFEKNFARLVMLSLKLVPQKPGRINARLIGNDKEKKTSGPQLG